MTATIPQRRPANLVATIELNLRMNLNHYIKSDDPQALRLPISRVDISKKASVENAVNNIAYVYKTLNITVEAKDGLIYVIATRKAT